MPFGLWLLVKTCQEHHSSSFESAMVEIPSLINRSAYDMHSEKVAPDARHTITVKVVDNFKMVAKDGFFHCQDYGQSFSDAPQ